MLLKTLIIVLGVVVVVMRSICVINPTIARRMMKSFIGRKPWIYVMALVVAVFGALLFWSARLRFSTYELGPWENWLDATRAFVTANTIWAIIMGAWCAIGGLLMLIAPGMFVGMVKKFVDMSDTVLRVLMLIGVAVGLAVLYLGIWIY